MEILGNTNMAAWWLHIYDMSNPVLHYRSVVKSDNLLQEDLKMNHRASYALMATKIPWLSVQRSSFIWLLAEIVQYHNFYINAFWQFCGIFFSQGGGFMDMFSMMSGMMENMVSFMVA